MDSSRIRRDLGWRPAYSFEQALKVTIQWYLDNRPWWEHIRSGVYRKYYETMYRRRLSKARHPQKQGKTR
jgi:dTDP-glucose 4,6-dehydratase